MRQCTKCLDRKVLVEFRKDRSRDSGVFPWCIACCRTSDRARYKAAPDKKKANSRQRRERVGPEAHTKYCEEWRARNKTYLLDYQREWRKQNRQRCAERIREWRKANPGRHRASQARRRAQKKGSQAPRDLRVTAIYEIAAWLRSKGDDVHVDHIIPLSKGGPHTYGNLQILTAQENLRKGSK